MNKVRKLIALTLIFTSLMGGTTAWGASLSGGVKGDNGQILMDITTLAGIGDFGAQDGAAASASFRSPSGMIVLSNGSVLVADSRNNLIRQIKDGRVSVFAGLSLKKDSKGFPIGGRYDGIKEEAFFQNPVGMAIDSGGNLIIADAGNNAIRKIDPNGNVTTVAGSGIIGIKDGAGTEASFNSPKDVVVAADGTLYVADTLNHLIRSISPGGQVKTLNSLSGRLVEVTPGQVVQAGDYADGSLAAAKFNEPTGLALDSKGNLFVSDTGNQRIRYIDLQKGTVSTVAGSSLNNDKTGLYGAADLYAPGDFADGPADHALFNTPQGIAVTDEGGLLIADSLNHSIRYLLNGQVTTIAGSSDQRAGEADGVDRGAQLKNPADVAVAADGSLLVTDAFNNKVRKIAPYKLPDDLPADGSISVAYGPALIAFDAKPEIVNDRTMVPVRAIAETLGYQVTFDDAVRSVRLAKDDVAVELYIGRTGIKRIEQAGQTVTYETDASPYIKEDRTYVPIRFFAEEIGLDVQWNEPARTAILRKKTEIKS